MIKKHYVILIGGGYGGFLFTGTEEDADDMRRHKATWEGAVGHKREADAEEAAGGPISHCWNHPNFKRRGRFHCECAECSPEGS